MEELQVEASPRVLARIGGVLYLIIIVLGIFNEAFVRNRIVVSGDAAATAANIRSLESLWRFGIAAEFVLLICGITLTLIFFILLRPVSRDLALLAVFFNLVSLAVEASVQLYLLGALFPLGKAEYLKAFQPEQLYAMASLSVKSHGYGFGVALIFFGCVCLILGYLIFRSGYLPKTVGVLMQIAGLSYLTDSFALILAPSFANRIFPAILIPAFLGEASLCLWLLVKGVNLEKWNARVVSAVRWGRAQHAAPLQLRFREGPGPATAPLPSASTDFAVADRGAHPRSPVLDVSAAIDVPFSNLHTVDVVGTEAALRRSRRGGPGRREHDARGEQGCAAEQENQLAGGRWGRGHVVLLSGDEGRAPKEIGEALQQRGAQRASDRCLRSLLEATRLAGLHVVEGVYSAGCPACKCTSLTTCTNW